jgi:hypothetical protein
MECAVSDAIAGMQFQDGVMQRIQNVNGALVLLSQAIAAFVPKSRAGHPIPEEEAAAVLIKDVAEQFSLSEMRERFLAALQCEGIFSRGRKDAPAKSSEALSIELFCMEEQ